MFIVRPLSVFRLRQDRNKYGLNLEVQLMLKQGQVEVNPGHFTPDYSRSLLVHRHVIEDLNSKVRALGEGKIASMEESKEFRKGIVILEWFVLQEAIVVRIWLFILMRNYFLRREF